MKRAGYFLAGILALALLAPAARSDDNPKKSPGEKNGGAAPKETPKEKKIPDEVKKFFDKQYFPQKHGLKDVRISMNLGIIPQLAAMAPDARIVVLWKAPDKSGMKLEGFPSEGPAAQWRGMILQTVKNISGSPVMAFIPPTLEDMARTMSFKAEKDGDATKITVTDDEDETHELILWVDKDLKMTKLTEKRGLQNMEAEVTQELKGEQYVVSEVQMDSPMGANSTTIEYEQVEGLWMRKALIVSQQMGEGEPGAGMRMELTSAVNKGVTDEEIKEAAEEADLGAPTDEDEVEEDEDTPPKKGPPAGEKKGAPAGDEDDE